MVNHATMKQILIPIHGFSCRLLGLIGLEDNLLLLKLLMTVLFTVGCFILVFLMWWLIVKPFLAQSRFPATHPTVLVPVRRLLNATGDPRWVNLPDHAIFVNYALRTTSARYGKQIVVGLRGHQPGEALSNLHIGKIATVLHKKSIKGIFEGDFNEFSIFKFMFFIIFLFILFSMVYNSIDYIYFNRKNSSPSSLFFLFFIISPRFAPMSFSALDTMRTLQRAGYNPYAAADVVLAPHQVTTAQMLN